MPLRFAGAIGEARAPGNYRCRPALTGLSTGAADSTGWLAVLFFLLLLQTAPSDPDPGGEPAFPRILDLAAKDCADGACDPGRRYRLDVDTVASERPKDRALRGVWQPCGTTGAAVCPSKRQQILHTDID